MKNKKRIIACFVILCTILAIFVYIKTDLFKTKEQLFWKYMLIEQKNVSKILSNDIIKNYTEKIDNSKHTKTGSISFTGRYKTIKPININFSKKCNNQNEIINTDINVIYNNKELANASIIKDKDYFLFKSNLIDENYIGFENNDLKELAKRLGAKNVNFIPDKIEPIDYYELFSISNKEKSHIIGKYVTIFRKHINNKDYYKDGNIEIDSIEDVTAYKLEVTKQDLKELAIDVLTTLKEDEETLQFISKKVKIIDKTNKNCNIDNVKEQIDEWIESLKDKEAAKKALKRNSEDEEEKKISIIIYKKGNDVIKVKLVFENDRTISLQLDEKENKIILKQYDVRNKEIKLDSIMGIVITILNNISEINYTRKIENNEKSNYEFNVICDIGIEKFEIKYKAKEKIDNSVNNFIKRDDVEFLDISKISEMTVRKLWEKMLKCKNFFD